MAPEIFGSISTKRLRLKARRKARLQRIKDEHREVKTKYERMSEKYREVKIENEALRNQNDALKRDLEYEIGSRKRSRCTEQTWGWR